MKAIILTETGPKIGLGHISRCLSLAYALKEKKIDVFFKISGTIQGDIKELDDIMIESENWVEFPELITTKLSNYDLIIIDSYNAKHEIFEKIELSKIVPVFIDDYNRVKYPKGIVVNSAAAAHTLNYPKSSDVLYLLGPHYSMLKHEFWEGFTRIHNAFPKNVLVTVGATDQKNITPRILEKIHENNPKYVINAVITPYFENIKEIKRISNRINCKIVHSSNTVQMRDLMVKSDIAITAGGQTSCELASMSVPSIVIVTAPNQVPNVLSLASQQVNYYAGRWDEQDLWKNLTKLLNQIQSRHAREKLAQNASKYVKSDGSREIVKKILDNV